MLSAQPTRAGSGPSRGRRPLLPGARFWGPSLCPPIAPFVSGAAVRSSLQALLCQEASWLSPLDSRPSCPPQPLPPLQPTDAATLAVGWGLGLRLSVSPALLPTCGDAVSRSPPKERTFSALWCPHATTSWVLSRNYSSWVFCREMGLFRPEQTTHVPRLQAAPWWAGWREGGRLRTAGAGSSSSVHVPRGRVRS